MRHYAVNTSVFSKFAADIFAAVAQLVEHRLPKPRVAGSSPVCRSTNFRSEDSWQFFLL